ncbi:succinyl-diaminopimelate desuccinylase [Sulfurimonas sp. HSL-3221]|uniref:succinyl-diaminopimelate desuccinylase n=1 Tax=Sulfurimonadaceae TaxID=2771471 RepID=UPI001E2A4F3B|nr:succinyl-diaminopimelate desuccinylase [Sulfurimonas sp. HSL-3221]UFS63303.1 succinyl-diaminopimelate desuccinylase [Sulfurimonas sp. HSL-3221]
MDVIALFKHLIERKSETPDDGGILDFVEGYLDGFTAVRIDVAEVKNLFIYKRFGEGEHLCFAGHVDVVPAGEGWDTDPYTAVEKAGKIYGRGAQDMKAGVSAFLQAVKETEAFRGTLSLLLTSDEEGPAKHGTVELLKWLQTEGMLPDACIVAEPTCEDEFGDAIKVGRRGSINGVIEKRGKQGHAAYPEKATNPIHKVAKVLHHMAGVNLDEGDEYFSPSQFVVTDIRAGMEVTNVTPGKLKMMFNVRNSTKTAKEDIEAFVHHYFKEMDYTLSLDQSAKPFVTDANTHIVRTIDAAIESVTGLRPKHSTAGGTSDARFIAEYGIDVIEFGVRNDTIHAPNECTTPEQVRGLCDVFKRVIATY